MGAWGGPGHGVTFYLSKTWPCTVISNLFQICRRSSLLPLSYIALLAFWCQCCQLSGILGQSKASDNRILDPFNRDNLRHASTYIGFNSIFGKP